MRGHCAHKEARSLKAWGVEHKEHIELTANLNIYWPTHFCSVNLHLGSNDRNGVHGQITEQMNLTKHDHSRPLGDLHST